RLLWRAGFGPRKGEAERLAKLGLAGAVRALVEPGDEELSGRAPTDRKGRPIAPADAWGHDHLWWLDRMVRTNRPLVERMTLVWHDWFATSLDGVGSQRLMLRQNALFRRHALGSFPELLRDVTRDPAMLLWLSGTDNTKWSPNENYARELMELFTLGAGRGYTERDVREQARALTGFRNEWNRNLGAHRFRFDPERHDRGTKRIFGKRGRFDWQDSLRLCLAHPRHPSFLVEKLWGSFVPTRPDASTRRRLERLYRKDGRVRPVVEAILLHPALHTGPRMVKPPVVYTAGLLRAVGRPVDSTEWSWLASMAGQRLFLPPNVAGWDDRRWLDTGTFRGRWWIASAAARSAVLSEKDAASVPSEPERLVDGALAFWGDPTVRAETRAALVLFARNALTDANSSWKRRAYPPLVANALRQLVAVSPDLQTC
ncbi:MAG TPA: DUF1800 domain-containing protein, partial [Gaiellaceae bacterium]|nr:DUF1800 domain-containing protein [Gaiellaceae bacterium]